MISLFRSVIDTEAALANLRAVFESGWLGLGPLTERFETELGKVIGAKHVVATNSCTSALHLAVRTLGLPRGAAVLTTPITFVSTNAVLLYEGLTPVFCDVDRWTGNLTPNSIARGITMFNPAAIMVVHLGGYPCDMDAINALAAERRIPVIEDCAHALGSTYKGRPVGSGANVCCWSFHAVKNLAISDGGAVSTQDGDLAARLRKLRWLGIDRTTADRTKAEGYTPGYNVEELGYKYHMNDVAAAIGLAQLPHLEEQNNRRRAIAWAYLTRINEARGLFDREVPYRAVSACHFVPLFFEDRDRVAQACREAGISVGHHYERNDKYDLFRGFPSTGDLPGAEWYDLHELTLPLHVGLTDEEVGRVIEVVNGVV